MKFTSSFKSYFALMLSFVKYERFVVRVFTLRKLYNKTMEVGE